MNPSPIYPTPASLFRTASALREMATAIGSTDVAARQWLDEGFSPGDAVAYMAAGCFDVSRTAALRQAGITPLQMARSGLGWEYCSGTLSLSDLRPRISSALQSECLLPV